MVNSLKNIAFFGCRLTSRYRQGLVREFNKAAEEAGVNIVYFHSVGEVDSSNPQYAHNEHAFLDNIDLDQFDGIVFDGEGYTVTGYSEAVIKRLRRAKCPIVSISGIIDGFININFQGVTGVWI